MRCINIIVLVILVSCKSEKQNATTIDQTVSDMWDSFITSNPEHAEQDIPESWFFHNNQRDADRLAVLTALGKKQASSGLYYWYEQGDADLPKVGTMHIVTDFKGRAKAIIQIKRVDTIPFNQITKEYAELDMGTNEEPLEKWKRAHWEFFSNTMTESGEEPREDMLVVCEWFETIWPADSSF